MKILNMLYKLLILIIVFAFILGAGTIYLNDVPLTAKPGIFQRLSLYLTRNHIESTPDHPIPELRPQHYPVTADELFTIVHKAVVDLGWRIEKTEPVQRRLHGVVITRFLRFKDDVHIHVQPDTQTTSVLDFRAKSRLGRADYGANLGHILRLKRSIERELKL